MNPKNNSVFVGWGGGNIIDGWHSSVPRKSTEFRAWLRPCFTQEQSLERRSNLNCKIRRDETSANICCEGMKRNANLYIILNMYSILYALINSSSTMPWIYRMNQCQQWIFLADYISWFVLLIWKKIWRVTISQLGDLIVQTLRLEKKFSPNEMNAHWTRRLVSQGW